jgi:AraC-like DNA-binding protein
VRYHEQSPPPDLASYVHCLWEIEGGPEALGQPIFPDGRVELIVHLGDRPRRMGEAAVQPRMLIVGQMTTAVRLEPVVRMHAVGVRFTPAGARAWLGVPLHALTGRIEEADAICRRTATHVQRAVEHASTVQERFTRLESALRATLHQRLASRVAERAVRLTLRSGGCASVDALSGACGVSARQLERQYLDAVGLSPKVFARIVRFQRAVKGLKAGVPAAAVAASCGFADQSHLAREFHRIAGAALRGVDLRHVAFVQDASLPCPAEW